MVTSNWTSLGAPGTINANPTIGKNDDGRLEAFARTGGVDGLELWHIWQVAPNGTWDNWASLGSPSPGLTFEGSPTIAVNDDGRLEIFATGLDSALWHIWQVAPNGPWDNWASLGGPPNVDIGHSIGVHVNDDGRLEIFATGSDSALWHIWQVTPNGPWGAWASLGKPPGPVFITTPLVSANDDGRLEAFVIGSDRALWHIWQTAPGAPWGGWASLGGPPTGNMVLYPFLRKNDDGRLEVFVTAESHSAVGVTGTLWHVWQVAPNSSWSPWASLAHPPNSAAVGGPVVGRNADGRLEVFALDAPGALWHIWQTSAGHGWFHWFSSGRPQVTLNWLDVIQNADGRLEVFALAEHAGIWHIWQTSPNGTWSPWALLGNGGPEGLSHLGVPHAARNADGRLEVFLTASTLGIPDIVLFHISQVTSGGGWGDWTSFDAPTNLSINSDVSVSENADGRLEVFLTNSDQTLWHAGQVTPGVWGS